MNLGAHELYGTVKLLLVTSSEKNKAVLILEWWCL